MRTAGRGIGFFLVIPADENGRYHIDKARSDLPDTFDLIASNGGRSGRVSVAPQQLQANIPLQAAAVLRGRLAGGGAASFRVDVTVAGQGFLGRNAQSLEYTGDRFEMTDVPGVPVHVVVTTDDGRSASLEVPLAPGVAQDVEVPLQALATVRGRLIDGSTKSPIPDVPLVVDMRGSQGPVFSSGDGSFQLRAAGGTHTLSGYAPAFRPLHQEFTAQPGQVVDLGDVALQKMTAQPGTIGVSLRGDSDTPPTVFSLVPGGPAEQAGVHLGDQVSAVDGKAVTGQSDAVSRIQGAPGTPVNIVFLRNGAPVAFTINRAP